MQSGALGFSITWLLNSVLLNTYVFEIWFGSSQLAIHSLIRNIVSIGMFKAR